MHPRLFSKSIQSTSLAFRYEALQPHATTPPPNLPMNFPTPVAQAAGGVAHDGWIRRQRDAGQPDPMWCSLWPTEDSGGTVHDKVEEAVLLTVGGRVARGEMEDDEGSMVCLAAHVHHVGHKLHANPRPGNGHNHARRRGSEKAIGGGKY